MSTHPQFSLTGILVKDPGSGRFTAYFAQFPDVIAEGNNEDEASENLIDTLQVVFDYKMSELKASGMLDNFKTKPFNFHIA